MRLMRTLVERIRSVERELDRPIGILVDLQGPKLRVGKFADGKVTLEVGQTFTLDDDPTPGDTKRVHLPHPEILQSVQAGDRLLIDDGRLELRAVQLRRHGRSRRSSSPAASSPTRRASACPTPSFRWAR